ncbi:MAG: helix-turn-helix transcriptional regulator [Clostridia bacterium]|nr:helix-turn-helix transcriptional regulator [Clostridia bacterium]
MFSQKLKKLRKQHGLTQAQLAEELNVGTSTIGMYENDIRKPSYSVLVKISDFFDVTIDYLIGNDRYTVDNISEIALAINKLSPDQKKQIMSFIEFLINNPPK